MAATSGVGRNSSGVGGGTTGVEIGCGVSSLCIDTGDCTSTTMGTGVTSVPNGLLSVIGGSGSATVTTVKSNGAGAGISGAQAASTGMATGCAV